MSLVVYFDSLLIDGRSVTQPTAILYLFSPGATSSAITPGICVIAKELTRLTLFVIGIYQGNVVGNKGVQTLRS